MREDGGTGVAVLGVFAADAAYRIERLPRMGETVLARSFALGPGGKGSNQAVAAGRLGARVSMIAKLGDDIFADLAERTWREAGVGFEGVRNPALKTGSAGILVNDETGDNVVIVAPEAGSTMSAADVDAAAGAIERATVFLTQLEQPLEAARRGLEIAREAGRTTILNPAPAAPLDDALLSLCDWVTPNETEAEALTGIEVDGIEAGERAGRALIDRGCGGAIVTLGEAGALLVTPGDAVHVAAIRAGPVVETTGAGDAFNGGFAVALSEGREPTKAVCFGCAVAGLSVTRGGAAASMPSRAEVDALR